ncbi:uncharacterized protein L201_004008 [Kwoniella dendrophila CBS 6074]|uniref:F-box domain-containing protein n=1 Tax=Kwoniella dendrophila CBS 6074 TaxID=1295534 RepID=A0AAX4JX10_9TREE
MNRLDNSLLSLILYQLDIPNLLTCSRLNKRFHNFILNDSKLQLAIYQELYQPPAGIVQNDLPARSKLSAYNEIRENIKIVQPGIKPFTITSDQEIHSSYDKYIFTRSNRLEIERGVHGKDGFGLVLSVWNQDDGTRSDLRLPFSIDYDQFAIDPEQDIMIVMEVSHDNPFIRSNCIIHAYHLFKYTDDSNPSVKIPLEYDAKGLDITGSRCDGNQGRYDNYDQDYLPLTKEFQIITNGRLILYWGSGTFTIYDWRTWTPLKCLPPSDSVDGWGSVISWVVTQDDLLIGIDYPQTKEFIAESHEGIVNHEIASLVVFDLAKVSRDQQDLFFPDLILELPITTRSIGEALWDYYRDGKHRKISVEAPDEHPILLDTQNPKFLTISMRYSYVARSSEIPLALQIVVPINKLRSYMIEHQKEYGNIPKFEFQRDMTSGNFESDLDDECEKYEDYIDDLGPKRVERLNQSEKGEIDISNLQNRIWQDSNDPFEEIRRIPFGNWKHFGKLSIVSDIPQEQLQCGWYLISYPIPQLDQEDKLRLSFWDYNQNNFLGQGERQNRTGSFSALCLWKRFQSCYHISNHYRKTINPVSNTKSQPAKIGSANKTLRWSVGFINYRSTIKLFKNGKYHKATFDGRRLIIQFERDDKSKSKILWILDFAEAFSSIY